MRGDDGLVRLEDILTISEAGSHLYDAGVVLSREAVKRVTELSGLVALGSRQLSISSRSVGALFEKASKGLDLLFGLDLQALPIDEAIVERSIAGTLDHLKCELSLLAQHTHRDIDTLLDPFGLRLQQLRGTEAVPDMAAILP